MKHSAPKPQILLVDDERMILCFLAEVLLDQGFAVTTASHFLDAIYLLESQHFDLLLCDVHLQDHNGFDVLALAQRRQRDIAAILISGFASERDRKRAEALGAGYLAKPLELHTLSRAIESLLFAKAA